MNCIPTKHRSATHPCPPLGTQFLHISGQSSLSPLEFLSRTHCSPPLQIRSVLLPHLTLQQRSSPHLSQSIFTPVGQTLRRPVKLRKPRSLSLPDLVRPQSQLHLDGLATDTPSASTLKELSLSLRQRWDSKAPIFPHPTLTSGSSTPFPFLSSSGCERLDGKPLKGFPPAYALLAGQHYPHSSPERRAIYLRTSLPFPLHLHPSRIAPAGVDLGRRSRLGFFQLRRQSCTDHRESER